jgi:hypothetical protein
LDTALLWGFKKKEKSVFEKAEQKEESESHKQKRLEEEKHQRWADQIAATGWQQTDDLDRLIASHIEQGFSGPELATALKAKDEEYRGGTAQKDVEKAWRRFHDSFNDNAEELYQDLFQTTLTNVKYMGRDQLNSIVTILRTLQQDDLADALSEEFVQAHMDTPEMFSTDSFFGDSRLDPYLAEKFYAARGLTEKPKQLADIVHRIAEDKDSWNSTDEQFLASASAEEIFAFLKAQNTRHLHAYIRVLLRFGQFGNSSEQQLAIANNTKAALRKIADESLLNRVRLGRYKLDQ